MNALRRPAEKPANQDPRSAILDMESPLLRAQGFIQAIYRLGACPSPIPPNVLHTLGSAALEAIEAVDREWRKADEATQPAGAR